MAGPLNNSSLPSRRDCLSLGGIALSQLVFPRELKGEGEKGITFTHVGGLKRYLARSQSYQGVNEILRGAVEALESDSGTIRKSGFSILTYVLPKMRSHIVNPPPIELLRLVSPVQEIRVEKRIDPDQRNQLRRLIPLLIPESEGASAMTRLPPIERGTNLLNYVAAMSEHSGIKFTFDAKVEARLQATADLALKAREITFAGLIEKVSMLGDCVPEFGDQDWHIHFSQRQGRPAFFRNWEGSLFVLTNNDQSSPHFDMRIFADPLRGVISIQKNSSHVFQAIARGTMRSNMQSVTLQTWNSPHCKRSEEITPICRGTMKSANATNPAVISDCLWGNGYREEVMIVDTSIAYKTVGMLVFKIEKSAEKDTNSIRMWVQPNPEVRFNLPSAGSLARAATSPALWAGYDQDGNLVPATFIKGREHNDFTSEYQLTFPRGSKIAFLRVNGYSDIEVRRLTIPLPGNTSTQATCWRGYSKLFG